MVNMSYCRFHNTNLALNECIDALVENENVSEEELKSGKIMFTNFCTFLLENGMIEDFNQDTIEDFFDNYEN